MGDFLAFVAAGRALKNGLNQMHAAINLKHIPKHAHGPRRKIRACTCALGI